MKSGMTRERSSRELSGFFRPLRGASKPVGRNAVASLRQAWSSGIGKRLRLRPPLWGRRCVRHGLLVMALFWFAGQRLVPKFRQLVVEGFDRLGALPQQIVDKGLLA